LTMDVISIVKSLRRHRAIGCLATLIGILFFVGSQTRTNICRRTSFSYSVDSLIEQGGYERSIAYVLKAADSISTQEMLNFQQEYKWVYRASSASFVLPTNEKGEGEAFTLTEEKNVLSPHVVPLLISDMWVTDSFYGLLINVAVPNINDRSSLGDGVCYLPDYIADPMMERRGFTSYEMFLESAPYVSFSSEGRTKLYRVANVLHVDGFSFAKEDQKYNDKDNGKKIRRLFGDFIITNDRSCLSSNSLSAAIVCDYAFTLPTNVAAHSYSKYPAGSFLTSVLASSDSKGPTIIKGSDSIGDCWAQNESPVKGLNPWLLTLAIFFWALGFILNAIRKGKRARRNLSIIHVLICVVSLCVLELLATFASVWLGNIFVSSVLLGLAFAFPIGWHAISLPDVLGLEEDLCVTKLSI